MQRWDIQRTVRGVVVVVAMMVHRCNNKPEKREKNSQIEKPEWLKCIYRVTHATVQYISNENETMVGTFQQWEFSLHLQWHNFVIPKHTEK